MTAAATNRVSMAFVEEVTFGVTPSGPPTLTEVRMTGESLKQTTTTAESAEIVSDRQIPNVVRTKVGADGDVNTELYAGDSLETWIKYAMQSPAKVASVATASLTCDSVQADNEITASTGTPFSILAVGEWVKIAGFANAETNGYFRVSAVDGGGSSFKTDQVIGADESTVAGVVVTQGAYYTNGTTMNSMSVEKQFEDLTNQFEVFTGLTLGGMNVSVPADGFLTVGFPTMGKQAASGTSTIGDGSNTAASTNETMNGVDSPVAFYENDTAMSFISLDMALNNNLRSRHNAGDAFAESIGAGKLSITGTFTAYFATAAALNRYLAGTASSLALVTIDRAGNVLVLDLPQVRLTSGTRVAGGQDQDVIAEIGFTAYKDATLGHTMRWSMF